MSDRTDFDDESRDFSDVGHVGEEERSRGREIVDQVAAKARELMPENVVEDAERSISNATTYVREKADNVATAVGNALEQTGNYLRDDGLNKITHELTAFVRRNPMPALLAGVAVGFLIAQVMHRRGDDYAHTGEVHG